MEDSTTIAPMGRLNKSKWAWGKIKRMAVIDGDINVEYRIQLWNDAIYSIVKYGRSTSKISESMQLKIHKFPSIEMHQRNR